MTCRIEISNDHCLLVVVCEEFKFVLAVVCEEFKVVLAVLDWLFVEIVAKKDHSLSKIVLC